MLSRSSCCFTAFVPNLFGLYFLVLMAAMNISKDLLEDISHAAPFCNVCRRILARRSRCGCGSSRRRRRRVCSFCPVHGQQRSGAGRNRHWPIIPKVRILEGCIPYVSEYGLVKCRVVTVVSKVTRQVERGGVVVRELMWTFGSSGSSRSSSSSWSPMTLASKGSLWPGVPTPFES